MENALCPACGAGLLIFERPVDGTIYQGCTECLSWPPFTDDQNLDAIQTFRSG